jgi:hypothetical protein
MEAMMAEPTPMPMCPMAEMCKGMMKKPFSGVMMLAMAGFVRRTGAKFQTMHDQPS